MSVPDDRAASDLAVRAIQLSDVIDPLVAGLVEALLERVQNLERVTVAQQATIVDQAARIGGLEASNAVLRTLAEPLEEWSIPAIVADLDETKRLVGYRARVLGDYS